MSGNVAAFLLEPRGRFEVHDAPLQQPGPGEVLVEVHASALQPADEKVARLSVIPVEYPAVLGSPVAGLVETVGHGVTKVVSGDRIVCGTKIFMQKKAIYGGTQRYTLVDESEVIEIGDIDFITAVTLASYTPPSALFAASGLNMKYPAIPAKPLSVEEQGKKIVIWGGSSAMGSLAISYAKQAGYTVISTSSPHNFGLLTSHGADHVFDHSDPMTVSNVRSLFPIHYWFDTISLKASLGAILEIVAPKGEPVTKTYIHMLLPMVMAGNIALPDGVTVGLHQFNTHAPENIEWAQYFLSRGGFMEQGIKTGIIKGVPPRLLGGLDTVFNGIEILREGVSAQKIVIDPWA